MIALYHQTVDGHEYHERCDHKFDLMNRSDLCADICATCYEVYGIIDRWNEYWSDKPIIINNMALFLG